MKVFDSICQGSDATEEIAREFASGFDFSESETSELNSPFKSYIDTVNGIEIYYDYAADYYFFSPKESTAKNLVGQSFYDYRYEDYYTVLSFDKSEDWLILDYKKSGIKREATSAITYYIGQGIHKPKINPL
ncbi:MAG: hypothetical protein ACI8Q1_000239 [Parvicella sp.]|jgi:hypothetical protein